LLPARPCGSLLAPTFKTQESRHKEGCRDHHQGVTRGRRWLLVHGARRRRSRRGR